MENMEQRYEHIHAHGFHIDVRGPIPLLIRGMVVVTCDSFNEAVKIAEAVIPD
jgi:hypothetical protein